MKKLSMLFLALIVAVTFSCSSDDSSSSDTYIKFKVNGVQYKFDNIATVSSLNGTLTGYQGSGDYLRAMTLTMPINPSVGEQTITAPSFDLDAYGASYAEGVEIDADATSGTMNIKSVSPEYVKGTFSFVGTYEGVTYTITEGEFKGYTPEEL